MSSKVEGESNTNILKTFNKIHDLIWEGGKNDPLSAFDEFIKIIFIKLSLEKNPDFNFREFYSSNSDEELKLFLKKQLDIYLPNNLFTNTSLNLSIPILKKIFDLLDTITISSSDEDLKGRAFEYFLGKNFRDDLGQYFTPRNITSFMVKFLSPEKYSKILDPACGSGGFLLSCYQYFKERDESAYSLFGIDINTRIINAASLEFLFYNLDNVYLKNSNSLIDLDKLQDFKSDSFDYIVTNPPFGSITDDTEILRNFTLSNYKKDQKTEILFIERCLHFLKEGGKMGIVIPDSILTNISLQYVRDFVFENSKVLAIISLPSHAFVPSGAGVKSSLLFLEKLKDQQLNSEENTDKIDMNEVDYDIFVANVKNIGFDNRGDTIQDDLPEILKDWKKWKKGEDDFSNGRIEKLSNLSKSFTVRNNHLSLFSGEKWTLTRLIDLTSNVFIGKTPSRQSYSDEDTGLKILKVRDLTGRGIHWDITERGFVYKDFFDKNRKLCLQLDDILIITSAHHPKYIGMKVDIVDFIPAQYLKKGVLLTAELMVIRINKTKIDPYFVYLFLKTSYGYNTIQSCIRGQSAHIYPKDIKNIQIPIPKKEFFVEIQQYIKNVKENLLVKSNSDQELIKSFFLTEKYFTE